MNSSDSLKLDEHLARLLAAYDQEIGGADGKAPTLDVPNPGPHSAFTLPGEEMVGPMSGGPVHQGSTGEVLPDSLPNDELPTPPPAPTVGTHRIGRFELRRQLGKGGCGIVFLAYDPKLQREVALKIPRPEMLLSPDARRRLIREAQAAAEFDHPNLVPVYETGEIGPVCFIATAFCPGQTLAQWLDRQAYPVPIRQAARLVAQIADAVQHAHDRGVLHRDLKPNNIILQVMKADPNDQGAPPGSCLLRGEHYVPRLVDFGLAKLAERGPSETASRQILGTPKYMAPEQAQARHEDVDARADVYGLGVMLYELLAGRAPFDGATDVEVLRQAIEGTLTQPRDLRSEIPRDLEAICLKAMARSPAKRYRTAIDLADDLRRFLDGLPTLARPLSGLGRAGRWLRRNDGALALATLSAIALFFLAMLTWNAYQFRLLRDDRDHDRREQSIRSRSDQQWQYARHVRDSFLSWRAGDAQQMADSLGYAQKTAKMIDEEPDFAWRYLSQLGRVELLSIPCAPGAVMALAVSPDGLRVATGHRDGTLAVWDRPAGRLLGSVKAEAGEVLHLAFIAGGTGLVTAGGNAAVRGWSLTADGTPQPGPSPVAVPSPVTTLAGSPDGKTVYIGTATGECLCWEVAGNRVAKSWTATDAGRVVALAISPDGQTIATAGPDEPVRLWQAGTGEKAGDEIRGAAGASTLAFARDAAGGPLLVTGRDDGTVRLFDRQGREVRVLPGHTGPVLTLTASPDGSAIASGGRDDCVCVWDVSTGSMRTLLRGHEQPVRGVRFGPAGRTLFTAAEDGFLKVWDLTADPEGPMVRGLPATVAALAHGPVGRGFAVATTDGTVELYPHQGGPPRRIPSAGRGQVNVLRWPESGPPVGVELNGRSAVYWEFGEQPRVVFQADARGGAATAVDFSLPAGQLAVGDDRGWITVWSLTWMRAVATIDTGLAAPVRHLCFSDDGRWLAAQTERNQIGVWELGDPKVRYRVPGHADGLWLVKFLPRGDRLVTAGRGSSIKVWTVATAREDLALLGHVGRVTGLTSSPDGRTLVSGSSTGEVKFWDLRTGQELIGLRRHAGMVTAAEFDLGGNLLITGGTGDGGRGELAFWESGKE